ncbi:MAG: M20/M25/M40 family metallo-hydrolase [Bacteroidia bacterium]|nr:M20/M25/M40 family metallo-hydrolase [Bacteroidia bacterium]
MFEKELSEATELLKKLIRIPSISREEGLCADLIENYIAENGYTVSRLKNNVWTIASGFDGNRPTLLLNSHIDTVKPVDGWSFDPFIPTEKDGKIYGLGSNDAGASVVALLHTFFLLSQENQPYNLIFSATAEEELSGKDGIELLLKELPKIDFAIVGEPTNMQFAVAEKGLMVLDCTAHGKAGHAARNEGENAIYKALADIEWFRNYRFPNVSEFLGEVKMSVTQINAGTQHNVVPDRCTFVVDIRSNELYSNEEILEEIKKHISCDAVPRSTRLSSSATPLNHPIIVKAKETGREIFGSPTLSDQALMPFPSVKIGPGKSSRSHTADEFVEIKEIEQGISVYYELLSGLNLY